MCVRIAKQSGESGHYFEPAYRGIDSSDTEAARCIRSNEWFGISRCLQQEWNRSNVRARTSQCVVRAPPGFSAACGRVTRSSVERGWRSLKTGEGQQRLLMQGTGKRTVCKQCNNCRKPRWSTKTTEASDGFDGIMAAACPRRGDQGLNYGRAGVTKLTQGKTRIRAHGAVTVHHQPHDDAACAAITDAAGTDRSMPANQYAR